MANENGLKNVRVVYGNSYTINMGNFENQKPAYEVSADVEDGVHPNEARDRLRALVDGWLQDDIKAVKDHA